METMARDRFQGVLQAAAADPEYQDLQRKCAALDEPVLAVLEKLPPADQTVITDYIRALGASALRLTELACEHLK